MKNSIPILAKFRAWLFGYKTDKYSDLKCTFIKIQSAKSIGLLAFCSILSLLSTAQVSQLSKLYVNMYSVSSTGTKSLADGIACTFYPTYNNAVDNQDAPKLNSFNTKESLTIVRDGTQLAIEKRSPITGNDTTFLQVIQMDYKNYEFEFIALNWNPLISAFLKDNFFGTLTPINTAMTDTTEYDFEVTSANEDSREEGRFAIIFAPFGELPVHYTSIKAIEINSQVNIEWKVENEINIDHYNIERSKDGINFTTLYIKRPSDNTSINKTYTYTDINPESGVSFYRISHLNKGGGITYSKIIRVSVGNKSNSSINLYPTVLTDKVVTMQMSNMKKGTYSFRMIGSLGNVIMTKTIRHNGGNSTEIINLDKNITKGLYQVNIIGPDNFSHSAKLISR